MLRGERVILRVITDSDLPRLIEFANDLEVELAGGGDPPSPRRPEAVRSVFEEEKDGLGRPKVNFAIEADGECIGNCGLFEVDQTSRTRELGITIGDKGYWGKGYGREAVRILLDYAFRVRNMRRVWLEVHADNERALRAYRASGFIEEGRLREHVWLDGYYVDMILMGVLRDEWGRAARVPRAALLSRSALQHISQRPAQVYWDDQLNGSRTSFEVFRPASHDSEGVHDAALRLCPKKLTC